MAYGNNAAPEKRKAFAADYVEVADRIRAWYEAYPNARIETEIISISDKLVVVKAQAFRGETPDEKPAGVGHSSMNPIVAAAKDIFGDIEIKESPIVTNWLDAIDVANDAAELQRVGQDIAGLDLTENERGLLQNAWKNKRAKFA